MFIGILNPKVPNFFRNATLKMCYWKFLLLQVLIKNMKTMEQIFEAEL